jgi:hypothetical protein
MLDGRVLPGQFAEELRNEHWHSLTSRSGPRTRRRPLGMSEWISKASWWKSTGTGTPCLFASDHSAGPGGPLAGQAGRQGNWMSHAPTGPWDVRLGIGGRIGRGDPSSAFRIRVKVSECADTIPLVGSCVRALPRVRCLSAWELQRPAMA